MKMTRREFLNISTAAAVVCAAGVLLAQPARQDRARTSTSIRLITFFMFCILSWFIKNVRPPKRAHKE